MENQKELFPELGAQEPRKKLVLPGFAAEKTVVVTLAYDKVILCILGGIIIIATAFAFGFEKGKKAAKTHGPAVAAAKAVAKPAALIGATRQRPYTILAATFKTKQYALDAAARLRAIGFSTVIIGVNGLYEVYAGEFADYREAAQGQASISKLHKGSQIRKR